MEHDLRSLFDIDPFSAADQLPNLSILDANSSSFKVRTGNVSDITPSSTLHVGQAFDHVTSKEPNCTGAHDTVVVSQVQDRERVDLRPYDARRNWDKHVSLLCRKEHCSGQTEFVQAESDMCETQRVLREPQFLDFRNMPSDLRSTESATMPFFSAEEMRSMQGEELIKPSTLRGREVEGSNTTDRDTVQSVGLTARNRINQALTGNRLDTDFPTGPNSNGSTLPCVPEADLGVKQSIGESFTQPQYSVSPARNAGNLLKNSTATEMIEEVNTFPARSSVVRDIPLLSIAKSAGINKNVPPASCLDIQVDNRNNNEALKKTHVTTNTNSVAKHLRSMNADYIQTLYDNATGISRHARGIMARNVHLSHQQRPGLVCRDLPYDAPITDFEISHGAFCGDVDAADIGNKRSDAGIGTQHQGALSHMSDGDLATASNPKTVRGRPEAGAEDDAPLSMWRQKRRKTNDVELSGVQDEKSKAEQMKLQRALRNRESARRSRIKSKVQFQNMERKYAELTDENMALTTLIDNLLPSGMHVIPKDAKAALESATNPPPEVHYPDVSRL